MLSKTAPAYSGVSEIFLPCRALPLATNPPLAVKLTVSLPDPNVIVPVLVLAVRRTLDEASCILKAEVLVVLIVVPCARLIPVALVPPSVSIPALAVSRLAACNEAAVATPDILRFPVSAVPGVAIRQGSCLASSVYEGEGSSVYTTSDTGDGLCAGTSETEEDAAAEVDVIL
jgi:hypothetical protein